MHPQSESIDGYVVSTPLRPEAISVVWQNIKPGIEEIKRKTPTATWMIEDVYHQLRAGHCALCLILYEGVIVGFFVTEDQIDRFTSARKLFIWLAWIKPGYPRAFDIAVRSIEAMAKAQGYTGMYGTSHRDGWERRLGRPDSGWIRKEVVWERNFSSTDEER